MVNGFRYFIGVTINSKDLISDSLKKTGGFLALGMSPFFRFMTFGGLMASC